MTDISGLFKQDETTFDMELKGRDPETGEEAETGVTFNVRSLRNPDASKVVRRERNRLFGKRIMDKSEADPEEVGALMLMETTDPTDDQLATCVVSWDWGDKTFGKLPVKYSQENVSAIIAAAPWIKEQVLRKVLSITDFTKA